MDVTNFYEDVAVCEKCDLCQSRNRVVFSELNTEADIFVVGNKPRVEEDLYLGEPFSDRCGLLLKKVMHEKLRIPQYRVYYTYVLKCIYGKQTIPQKYYSTCMTNWFFKELEAIKPKKMIIFGRATYENIFKTKDFTEKNNSFADYKDIKCFITKNEFQIFSGSQMLIDRTSNYIEMLINGKLCSKDF